MNDLTQYIYNVWTIVKPLLIIITSLNICLYVFFHTRIKKYPEKIEFLLNAKKRLLFWIIPSIIMLIFMELFYYYVSL